MPNAWEQGIVARLRSRFTSPLSPDRRTRRRLFHIEKLESRYALTAEIVAEPVLELLESSENYSSAFETVTLDTSSMVETATTSYTTQSSDPYGGDPYGGDPYGGDPYGGDPNTGVAPTITAFDIVFLGDGDWQLSGTVVDDEGFENLKMFFGGDLIGECWLSLDGNFSEVIHAPSVTSGSVSAAFTDSDGLAAELAWQLFG